MRMKVLFVISIAVLFPLLANSQSDTVRSVSAPQLCMTCLDIPDGFVQSEKNPGAFSHPSTNSSITVYSFEGQNIIDFKEGMNEDYFELQSMSLVNEFKLQTDKKQEVTVFKVSTADKEYVHYYVITGDYNHVIFALMSYPLKYESLVDELLLTSMKTLKRPSHD